MKRLKRGERVLKGGANLNRLRILDFIGKENYTSVWAISQNLKISFANTSQHLQKLERTGLISKHHQGPSVYHELTPYGDKVLDFIKDLK